MWNQIIKKRLWWSANQASKKLRLLYINNSVCWLLTTIFKTNCHILLSWQWENHFWTIVSSSDLQCWCSAVWLISTLLRPGWTFRGLLVSDACVSVYLSQQASSPGWNNPSLEQTRSHTPNRCWWALTFLLCVILGALPAVISPVKNDVFILANKRISRVATPAHYDWSNVWSLTIRCHSPWRKEDGVQFMQSAPATYERSKCVTFLGWGGG